MASLFRIGSQFGRIKVKSDSLATLKNVQKTFKKFTTTSTTTAYSISANTVNVNKKIGIWLAGCSGMVAGAVVLGGVTRLTESGLSMVDWRLIKDMIPPKNEQEWHDEFEKYKQFPEWKYLNKDREMTLNQFKFIFYMEWGHRMWGRATGLVFLLPAAYFWRKGYFNSAMKKRIGAFSLLLGFQGFLGWYMVKSGLNEPEKQTDVPRVSQYRLASHLSAAFLLYTGFLWTSLMHFFPNEVKTAPINGQLLKKVSMRSHYLLGLIFTTAVAGAFVAGLDAGLVYNSFPKMADRWIPCDLFTIEPKWKNFFENPTMVQFQHRILGISTLTGILLYAFSLRRVNIPPRARLALNSLVTMSFVQVGLGISTLLLYVPVSLAALHQSGSLALLSFAIWLASELKRIPKI
jgi:cytochrome c oxidase assembly protein subunit 15